MTVYLLHLDPPLAHSSHYIGFCTSERMVQPRLDHHMAGNGARMMRAAAAAGCRVTVAHVWPDGDRNFERRLKRRKDATKFCPVCGGGKRPLPIYSKESAL
jgi:hypothetical protein